MNRLGNKVDSLVEAAVGKGVSQKQALALATAPDRDLPALMAGADFLRRRRFSNEIRLCSIVNARSGDCEQDCAFCAQSAHHRADIDSYGFLSDERIGLAARSARETRASAFSIVTSGGALIGADLERAVRVVGLLAQQEDLSVCASLGALGYEALAKLQQAGLTRFHHNLETARSFYPHVCSTRDFQDKIETINDARRVGLKLCVGALFGLGESPAQRVELAYELQSLNVDSVPINYLIPIKGTPLEGSGRLSPMDCLRILVLFRFVLPDAHLVLCGGREQNLRQLQPWAFAAGASGMMIGNYLTTQGRDPRLDLEMLDQLGLSPSEGKSACPTRG